MWAGWPSCSWARQGEVSRGLRSGVRCPVKGVAGDGMTRIKRLAPFGCLALDLSPAACHGRRHDFIEARPLLDMALSGGLQITSANQQIRRPGFMIAVGVDTHKEQHFAVAVDELGQLLGEITVTADLAGYRSMADWLGELEGQVLVGIEGAGSFGAGLCEYLQAEGVEVFEVERPRRRERRTGKSDRLDALIAAKKVLAGEGLSTPRGSGTRLALQMLLVAYRSVVGERSRLYNQLQALHVGAPGALRERIGPTRNGARLAIVGRGVSFTLRVPFLWSL